MNELAIVGTPDPVTMIERSGLAESTKSKYKRVIEGYPGNLGDVDGLRRYASGLSQSRRAHLRSALSLWARETAMHIKGAVTEDTKDRAQVLLMRLESIPQVVKVERAKGTKAHQ